VRYLNGMIHTYNIVLSCGGGKHSIFAAVLQLVVRDYGVVYIATVSPNQKDVEIGS
jgi:hypothetical protein